jgi:isopentenyl phosphate kinase
MIKLQNNRRSWSGAIGIGIAVSALTAIVMVTLLKMGVSPFPRPPSLAFAETVLGRKLPMPVGLLFHVVYVTFWSVVFVQFFPKRNFWTAIGPCTSSFRSVL